MNITKRMLYSFTGVVGGFITSITLFESNIYGGIFFAIAGFLIANNILEATADNSDFKTASPKLKHS